MCIRNNIEILNFVHLYGCVCISKVWQLHQVMLSKGQTSALTNDDTRKIISTMVKRFQQALNGSSDSNL